jgi:hypothetical protein
MNTDTLLDLKPILQLKYMIYLCTSLISYNRRLILEKDFLIKHLDFDLNNVAMSTEINNSDEGLYSLILISIFKVMDTYINYIKTEKFTALFHLEDCLLYFLKTFTKTFLSRKLNKDYYCIFKYIAQKLNGNDDSVILNFIITFIIDIWSNKSVKKDVANVNKKLCEIFEILVNNCCMSLNDNLEKETYLGRLILSEKSFKDIIALHGTVISFDPLKEGKLRKLFYHGLTKIMLLESNNQRYTMFKDLLGFYYDKLHSPVEYVDMNCYIGYLKDFTGITSAITSSVDYNDFLSSIEFTVFHIDKIIRAHYTNPYLIKTVLKFYTELTFNRINRFGSLKQGNI